jgi:hypothetical protein
MSHSDMIAIHAFCDAKQSQQLESFQLECMVVNRSDNMLGFTAQNRMAITSSIKNV